MNIEQLQDMWAEDAEIDSIHLDDEALKTPKLHSKYVKMLTNIKLKHAKYQSEYNVLRKNKFRYFRGEMSREELTETGWDQWQGVKPLKNEMDEFLTGDGDLNSLEVKMKYLETMMYLLESILGQIKARDWQIKSAIEFKRLLAG